MTSQESECGPEAPTSSSSSRPVQSAPPGEQLYLNTRIPLLLAVIIAGTLVARYLLGIQARNERFLYVVVALIAGYCVGAWLVARQHRSLERTSRDDRRLSEMRRDFLHIALHNLQSSVGASTMLLSNLRDGLVGSLTDEQKELVNRALRRLAGLTDSIADMQTLSALESGGLALQASEFDVQRMLESVVDEYREVADAHKHDLVLEVDPGTPPARGIERLIREAVVNYITNAIKYTPDGGRISIRALGTATALRIEVSDSGIGISPADQDRLFNEFVRIERDDSPVGKVLGSGLGLSIVRRVVEAHGGSAFVESELGAGSTFVIEIPLNAAST